MKKLLAYSLSVLLLLLMGQAHAMLPARDSQGEQVPTLSPLLKKVNPAVVSISVEATRTVNNPLLQDPFFRRFFNAPEGGQKRRTQSAGSGVIVDAEAGTIMTNFHVVKNADVINVSTENGEIYQAELLGSDPEVDIAILKIDANNLTEIPLGDSSLMEVGDFVVAIGNPFGLGHTVTTGIVSALGRTGLGIGGYENYIQTDASINPGNSGGALINLKGELVGINTAIIGPAGGNVGIGFSIPTNMAKTVMDQIIEYGDVQRGLLGIMIQDLTGDLAEAFELEDTIKGVLITDVQPDSPAEEAGLKSGDVVLNLNGKPVLSSAQLRNAVGLKRAGTEVTLKVLRDGDEQQFDVIIGEAKGSKIAKKSGSQNSGLLAGVELAETEGKGVEVKQMEPTSKAARSGLRPGDVIVAANRQQIEDLDDLEDAIEDSGDRLLLRVERNRGALYIVLKADQ